MTSLQEVRGVIEFKLEGRPGEETGISMQGVAFRAHVGPGHPLVRARPEEKSF